MAFYLPNASFELLNSQLQSHLHQIDTASGFTVAPSGGGSGGGGSSSGLVSTHHHHHTAASLGSERSGTSGGGGDNDEDSQGLRIIDQQRDQQCFHLRIEAFSCRKTARAAAAVVSSSTAPASKVAPKVSSSAMTTTDDGMAGAVSSSAMMMTMGMGDDIMVGSTSQMMYSPGPATTGYAPLFAEAPASAAMDFTSSTAAGAAVTSFAGDVITSPLSAHTFPAVPSATALASWSAAAGGAPGGIVGSTGRAAAGGGTMATHHTSSSSATDVIREHLGALIAVLNSSYTHDGFDFEGALTEHDFRRFPSFAKFRQEIDSLTSGATAAAFRLPLDPRQGLADDAMTTIAPLSNPSEVGAGGGGGGSMGLSRQMTDTKRGDVASSMPAPDAVTPSRSSVASAIATELLLGTFAAATSPLQQQQQQLLTAALSSGIIGNSAAAPQSFTNAYFWKSIAEVLNRSSNDGHIRSSSATVLAPPTTAASDAAALENAECFVLCAPSLDPLLTPRRRLAASAADADDGAATTTTTSSLVFTEEPAKAVWARHYFLYGRRHRVMVALTAWVGPENP